MFLTTFEKNYSFSVLFNFVIYFENGRKKPKLIETVRQTVHGVP